MSGRTWRFVPFVLCFSLLVANPAAAQGTGASVSGTVTRGGGGTLAGATVTIQGTQFSTSTDGGGDYRFVSVPPGKYTIAFSMPGLKTVQIPVDLTPGGSFTVNAELEPSTVDESVNITLSLDAGETEKLNVASSTGAITQTFNGVTGPRIDVDDTEELRREKISEKYRRALAGIRWNVNDNGRTTLWVSAGAFVGNQDLTIDRRTGDSITYSGTQVGGYAGISIRQQQGANEFHGNTFYFGSKGDVSRSPNDFFSNARVVSATHTLTVHRVEASATYGYASGPIKVSAGPEFFYFKFNRSGTIQADSTTSPGASATIENESRFDRSGVRVVAGLEYGVSDKVTLTSTFKVGSANRSGAIGLRWTF